MKTSPKTARYDVRLLGPRIQALGFIMGFLKDAIHAATMATMEAGSTSSYKQQTECTQGVVT
jgi:hypothetical protein